MEYALGQPKRALHESAARARPQSCRRCAHRVCQHWIVARSRPLDRLRYQCGNTERSLPGAPHSFTHELEPPQLLKHATTLTTWRLRTKYKHQTELDNRM